MLDGGIMKSVFCRLKWLILLFGLLSAHTSLIAQEVPIDRFCDIYADSYPDRLEKIFRLFDLQYRKAEQLRGDADCPNGDVFVLRTSCVGPYKVAIFSISNQRTQKRPSSASKLFHLVTTQNGIETLTPCVDEK